MEELALGLQLIVFQTLDGRDIHVNPQHIVSISRARKEDDPNKMLTGKVHCVLILSNGTRISVVEECASVRKRLEELR